MENIEKIIAPKNPILFYKQILLDMLKIIHQKWYQR